jgi:hypothetical protein
VKGMLFGLIVWASSYNGWVPAADLLPPATQTRAKRNSMMIFAHLVYGTIVSLVLREKEE